MRFNLSNMHASFFLHPVYNSISNVLQSILEFSMPWHWCACIEDICCIFKRHLYNIIKMWQSIGYSHVVKTLHCTLLHVFNSFTWSSTNPEKTALLFHMHLFSQSVCPIEPNHINQQHLVPHHCQSSLIAFGIAIYVVRVTSEFLSVLYTWV